MLKSFTDLNGTKVYAGDLVSVTGKDLEILVVKGIERGRKKIEVKLYSNLNGQYYYASSKKLVSEM